MLRVLRESFAAKLFAGLLGTVGLLMLVTYGVVQSVTATQVQQASERATQNAATQFTKLDSIRLQLAARVARPLTQAPRIHALLDEAVETGDLSLLAGEVVYQVDLFQLDDVLVAFTDTRGRPVLTLHGSVAMEGADPAGVTPIAERVLSGEAMEGRSYRVLDGELFSIRTTLIQVGGRAIGTLSVGLVVPDEEVTEAGDVLGVEVCLVVEGSCTAGTARAREALDLFMDHMGDRGAARDVEVLGDTWSVRLQPLVEADPGQGERLIAVPLGPVLAPFRRIKAALLLGGGFALVLSVVVGVALSRGLTRPVRALVAATGRVAEGDYEAEVPVTTRDELGTLAAAFNDMTHGLLLKERLRVILDVVSSREVAEELVRGGLELGGENRQVTVLFADIRGFSTLTEGMEPQAVIGLLNECMQRLSDAVVEERGHVDKFVGDELMAVFNAPKEVQDHAGRALRAAVGMQAAMRVLNRERAARGEAAIGLGIGINTGEVVAGKMGSQTRNNYTVLGDTVNLASRLCSAAGAGEILVTRGCVEASETTVHAEELGGRAFKGFTEEVAVVAVHGVGGSSPEGGSGPARTSPIASALIALGLLVGGAADLPAQALPTLSDLGLEYLSADGAVQLSLSGRVDLEAYRFPEGVYGLAGAGAGEGLVAPRIRLFTDLFLGDHVYGLLEMRADRGHAPQPVSMDARLEQVYLRVTRGDGSVSLQVGRFASPFGSYPLRHLSPADPFIRPPLIYDYRTMMCAGIAPPTAEAFLTWRDRPDEFRSIGAPPVWDVPYQWGAMVAGSSGPVRYRLAAMNSAPSSGPGAWGWDGERMRHPSLVAGVGVTVSPAFSLGASFNRGPWLEPLKQGTFPEGRGRWDHLQTMVSLDATYARGPWVARAEVVRDQWDVPNLSEAPVEYGGSMELQVDVTAGFFVAGRVGVLDFRPVAGEAGGRDWDYDVTRVEASAGYRLDRNSGVLASLGRTSAPSVLEPAQGMLAVQWWWTF